MSIAQTIEDAEFLKKEGRYIAALAQAFIAIAASSKIKFPEGVRSRWKPSKNMSDREAFITFLGTELRRKYFSYAYGLDASSGIIVDLDGEAQPIERILYEKYRCGLIHEAKLSSQFELIEDADPAAVSINRANGKLAIGYSWIDLLLQIVKTAPSNGKELGYIGYEFRMIGVFDEAELSDGLRLKYMTWPWNEIPFPLHVFRQFIQLMPGVNLSRLDDPALSEMFAESIDKQLISGSIAGLRDRGLIDHAHKLTKIGILIAREVGTRYEMIEI
ncbi:hypothetical protein QZH45_14280 [Pseudomonas corrugata]|uniref:hypothetical protein n=1 Tax=Pseudomonas corrugata TaxID=47879 RepID=UPI003D8138E9